MPGTHLRQYGPGSAVPVPVVTPFGRRSRLPAQIQTRDPDKIKRFLALYQDRPTGISSPTSYIPKQLFASEWVYPVEHGDVPGPCPSWALIRVREKAKTPTLAAARQRYGARRTSASEPCSFHECLAYMVAHLMQLQPDVSLRTSLTSSGAASRASE